LSEVFTSVETEGHFTCFLWRTNNKNESKNNSRKYIPIRQYMIHLLIIQCLCIFYF